MPYCNIVHGEVICSTLSLLLPDNVYGCNNADCPAGRGANVLVMVTRDGEKIESCSTESGVVGVKPVFFQARQS